MSHDLSGAPRPAPPADAAALRVLPRRGRPPRGLWCSDGLAEVESTMRRVVAGGRVDILGTILRDHLATGGKRLRARLALASAEALGADRGRVVGWAAACELLHNASLLHDDLQDGDRERRGVEAAWVRHGAAQAINAGDLGLMLPWVALSEVPVAPERLWAMSLALARHAERVARGQAHELELLPRRALSWQDYADVAREKTAALFSLPVLGAAIAAGVDPAEAEVLARAVEPVGVLFQIQDDVLDLFGDKARAPGSDIARGKVTALVAEHLRIYPSEQDDLVALLERPGADEATVAGLAGRFASGGALRAVWDRMGELEHEVMDSPALSEHPRLQALALDLVAGAVAPVAHTAPTDILAGGLG